MPRVTHTHRSLLLLCACLAFAPLAACGNNEDGNTTNNTTQTNNTAGTNNTTGANNTNNTAGTNNATNNTTQTNNATNNTTGNTTGAAARCADHPAGDPARPARCDADPSSFDGWASASVVTNITLLEDEDACCFDFDGDDIDDNAIGSLLSTLADAFGDVTDVFGSANQGIQQSIDNGNIAVVLEHDGLASLDGGRFAVNFLLGDPDGFTKPSPDGSNLYTINPASFEAGAYPMARAEGATLSAGVVQAGPGRIAMTLELLVGVKLDLAIDAVFIKATVDANRSDLDGRGVALQSGELAGVLKIKTVVDAVNQGARSACGCVTGLGDNDMIELPGGDLQQIMCREGMNADACDASDDLQNACKQLVSNCSLLSLIPNVADVNSERIGEPCEVEAGAASQCDAISVGATFTAAGAKIKGVTPPM